MRNRGSPSRGSSRASTGQTPLPARGPAAGLRCTTISRVIGAAVGGGVLAHEHRLPRARRGRGDLGEPEIRRPAVPLARCGGDISIRRDQRQLAVERLLRGEDDAQGRALPRRHRRGEHGKPSLVLAIGDWCLRLGFGCLAACLAAKAAEEAASAHGDQQRCDRGSSQLARRHHWNPPCDSVGAPKNTPKCWVQSWQFAPRQ